MNRILIVYGTSYGQTTKVVGRITRHLAQSGHQVTVWKGDELPEHYSLDGFEAILVAGSVLYGKHQPYLTEFVKRHARRLNILPSAFVSVCGAMAGKWERGPEEAQKYVTRFLEQTGWMPLIARSVAGGLPYTQYGWATRWIMRTISRATGRPTDTSRDWEFTDWDAVDRLAAEFEAELPVAAGRH